MTSSNSRTIVPAAVLVLVAGLLSGCGDGHARTAGGTVSTPAATAVSATSQARVSQQLGRIEHSFHARLGVFALDTGTGRTVTYQADDRFAYCSTIKALAAGVLFERDTDEQLDHVVTYRAADIVDDSPITPQHVGTGMTVRDLIAAALRFSDNTALDLLLNQIGGPSGLQTALRGLGDSTTLVARTEPSLNDATPGDTRDTSTARALGTDLRGLVLGDTLTTSRRQALTSLLVANTTGGPYIRAGVPTGWKVGDKTGNGGYGTRNDIAIVWPAHGSPIVLAILSDRGSANATSDDALIADATKTAIAALR